MLPLQPFIALQCALLFSIFLERGGLPTRERFWRYARKVETILALLLVATVMAIGAAHVIDWGRHPLEDIVKFACGPLTMRAATVVLLTLTGINLLRRGGTNLPYGRMWALLMVAMTVAVSAGNVVKGTLKGWPLITEQLLLAAGDTTKIVVIKDPFDEYFDPIFFYAHRPVAIASDTKGIDDCGNATVYAARRSWVEQNPHLIPGSIRHIATLRELNRAFGGNAKGEDIVVFECSTQKEQPSVVGGTLQDAVLGS
jgi:hypothetical protein